MRVSTRFVSVFTIGALAIMRVTPAGAAAPPAKAPEPEPSPDIADMQVQDLRAGGDEKKRYFLIRRPGEPPATGWRTLFVLPGGPGSADFQPFVTRIAKF